MTEIDLDQVRRRPSMYLGSTMPSGVHNLVFEVVGNSFDVVLAGLATRISVTAHRDGSVTITDDGPGIQLFDRTGPTVEELFTIVRDTPTADGHWPHLHLSTGIGLGPVCALSSELEMEVRRDGAVHRQTFARGAATSALVRTEAPDDRTGTTIRLRPDPEIFEDPTIPLYRLTEDLRHLALLHPGLVTELVVDDGDSQVAGPVTDLVPFFRDVFPDHGVPTTPAEPFLLSTIGADHRVDLAIAWSGRFGTTNIVSYGNYRRTVEPSHDLHGIEEGLREVFGHGPLRELTRGMRIALHVQLVDPVFPGPTRQRLISPEVVWRVADTIAEQLPGQLALHPELEADLRSRVPTRALVASGAYDDEDLRARRKTPS